MRRFEREEDRAAMHGLRGRRSNWAHAPEVRERVLGLVADPLYAGFGPPLLAEHARTRHAHHPLPPEADLEALFAETETRVVGRGHTVRWRNGFWQIPEAEAGAARRAARLAASNTSGDPGRPPPPPVQSDAMTGPASHVLGRLRGHAQ